ncbi:MAG: hypothetical protein IKZ44_03350 [Clostridia bacterium]|nr:hypothetical protein [Clostridia bacterium]
MEAIKQRRALVFSLASFMIGICIIPAWFLSLATAYWREGTGANLLWGIFFFGMPLIALTGLVFGVIGLIGSIRKESHSTKGIAFASIGIALTFAEAVFTVLLLLFVTVSTESSMPL